MKKTNQASPPEEGFLVFLVGVTMVQSVCHQSVSTELSYLQ